PPHPGPTLFPYTTLFRSFATALTLMLRSQGIPARVVLGYQGAEDQGEGLYYVRQSHAHSWVEAMIQRTERDGRTKQNGPPGYFRSEEHTSELQSPYDPVC